MRFLNAARLAYGLNSCKAFGLDSTNCDIYDGTHLTIIADYNQDSLKLTIVDVNEVGAFPSSQIRLDQRSSVEPLEVRMMDETWGALQEAFPATDPHQKIVLAFHDFIDSNFNKDHTPKDKNPDHFEDARTIILSCEASKTAMDLFRNILKEVLPPELQDKIRNSIDPRFVSAAGASASG